AHGLHGPERIAGLGEQMSHDERRVAEHIVENATALQHAVPEPRRVRAAVLLGGARELRAAGSRHAARPEQFLPGLDVRCEQLVLQVSRRNADALHELDYLLRLRHGPAERLLAGDALERALAA